MKKLMSNDEILNHYIESCDIIYSTELTGDYKNGNKEGKKLIKIFKYLENNVEQAKEIFPKLFSSNNFVLRATIAAHCLALNIYIKEAEEIFEIDSENLTIGIYRLNAEMTLKVWREEGKLEVYQK